MVVQQFAAGVDPQALAVSQNSVDVLTQDGVSEFDPATQLWTKTIAVPGVPATLAAGYGRIVVVGDGTARFYDGTSGVETRPPLAFAESPGCVVMALDAAWICNTSNWKVDRFDLASGGFEPVGIAYPPTSIVAAGKSIWVATSRGVLEQIDMARHRVVVYEIPTGENAMAFGLGVIWIAYASDGVLVQVDPQTGRASIAPTRLAQQTNAFAFADGFAWATSLATNQLQRIDPDGRVVGRMTLPSEPQGLVFAHGYLYSVTAAGELVKMQITSQSQANRSAVRLSAFGSLTSPLGLPLGRD
jgi:hypothetical protein